MAHVAKLYFRSQRFACRRCQRLAYRVENLDRVQRLWVAQERIERRLDDDLGRPRGMHQATYMTVLARYKTIEKDRHGSLDAKLFKRVAEL